MKRITRVSKVPAKKIIEILRRLEIFMIRFEVICLKLLTVMEKSIYEMIRRIFFKFLGLNSSAVGLILDFLTSGFGFVKYC